MSEDVYVVGIDMIKFGRFPEKSVSELGAQAALLALAHDGIFSFTLDQKIDFWSRGAESMYGYTAAEATGRNPGEL